MFLSAPVAKLVHSSNALVVAVVSNAEPWPKEKIKGLGCHGFGFEYIMSLKSVWETCEAGTLLTGRYACRLPGIYVSYRSR